MFKLELYVFLTRQLGGIALRPFKIQELLEFTVLGSISRAYGIGKAILNARNKESNLNPVDAILAFTGGKKMISGKVG